MCTPVVEKTVSLFQFWSEISLVDGRDTLPNASRVGVIPTIL